MNMKYNHLGIPVKKRFEGEIDLPQLKMVVSDHEKHPFKVQFMRFYDDAPYPDIVKELPHLAYEVEDIYEEIKCKNVIIAPNSPSKGLIVAFIEVDGAPIELMQYE